MDRQSYYRAVRRKKIKQTKAVLVVKMVEQKRIAMPRIGGRKLYYLLLDELGNIKIGRDKFFDILRANHLLIAPKRSYHITTNSHHRFRKHQNMVRDLSIVKPAQVWAADITYIGKREKPCYLSLITDAYSKKIVGHYVSNSLSTDGCLKALKAANRNRIYPTNDIIHHSDRGLQYCSDEYQHLLQKSKIKCSMTQNSDPYENAVAERVNGILKQEFMIDTYHLDLTLMKDIVKEAIDIYNQMRPHWSNSMLTPNQIHTQNEVKIKIYKTKNSSKLLPTTA